MVLKKLFLVFLSIFFFSSCTPKFIPTGDVIEKPTLAEKVFVSFDGTKLPLKIWLPNNNPQSIFIALHGFNDYSNFIKDNIGLLNKQKIGVYSYDQRGFGESLNKGMWPSQEALCRDLNTIISLVKKRHPEIPLYLLGDSMGGAIIMVAYTESDPHQVDGIIMVAPAVWSRSNMPFYQRWALWLLAHTMPWGIVSGQSLDITPSDNEEMLEKLGKDPLVIKESRIDTVYGLTNLMDAAYDAAAYFNAKVLFLYGKKDEIIPSAPMAKVFKKRFNGQFSQTQRFIVYENGYHMLLRDLQAEVVWQDIFSWLGNSSVKFPSVQAGAAIEIISEKEIKTFYLP